MINHTVLLWLQWFDVLMCLLIPGGKGLVDVCVCSVCVCVCVCVCPERLMIAGHASLFPKHHQADVDYPSILQMVHEVGSIRRAMEQKQN